MLCKIFAGSTRAAKRSTKSSARVESRPRHLDRYLKTNLDKEKKRLIFQNMEFLLTGFSPQKEKEIEGLIRKYGGIVLSQVPSTNLNGKRSARLKSQVLPVVLCLKKVSAILYVLRILSFIFKFLFFSSQLRHLVQSFGSQSDTKIKFISL